MDAAKVRTDLQNKYLGAIIGSALGDAIGELAFRHPEKARVLELVGRQEELSYTDDTAMAIGLAESILEIGSIDQQHLGDTFSRNYQREPWRGYGPGPPIIFSMVHSSGISYIEAAQSLFGGGGSLGNGAAMRIVPVGLFFHNTENLYDKACVSAEVTHTHPVGKDGAAVQALSVAQAVRLQPQNAFPLEIFVRGLRDLARTPEIRGKMELIQELIAEDASPDIAADRLGRTVAVDQSMPFAIFCFLRNPKSFEDCLFCAILNEGDRDTLGAMACAISGAYLGIDAIPKSWREKLENRVTIESLASALIERTSI